MSWCVRWFVLSIFIFLIILYSLAGFCAVGLRLGGTLGDLGSKLCLPLHCAVPLKTCHQLLHLACRSNSAAFQPQSRARGGGGNFLQRWTAAAYAASVLWLPLYWIHSSLLVLSRLGLLPRPNPQSFKIAHRWLCPALALKQQFPSCKHRRRAQHSMTHPSPTQHTLTRV